MYNQEQIAQKMKDKLDKFKNKNQSSFWENWTTGYELIMDMLFEYNEIGGEDEVRFQGAYDALRDFESLYAPKMFEDAYEEGITT